MNRRVAQRQALRGGRQEGAGPDEEEVQREIRRAAAEEARRETRREEEAAEEAAIRRLRTDLHRDLSLMENTRREMERERRAGEDFTRSVRGRFVNDTTRNVRRRYGNDRALYHRFMILFNDNLPKIVSRGQDHRTSEESLQKINLLRDFLHLHPDLEFEADEGNRIINRLKRVHLEYNYDILKRLRREIRKRTDFSVEYFNSLVDPTTDDEQTDDFTTDEE